ncbi:uncharacterized protein BYT42DRAFT_148110 [Radiomyces spectabilis]|uniref:uncharacterized protein n=1 Tax=Radiomyces spectabilis TaxID=64574 RepID=UPI0022209A7E|nr:uncharacterized protein BYT42DRAFT_148110 [Radiomyces spectabilis]KAI8365963.1 hypothetical protein BYT42DRAFT_148110 [Radiomyces spectabilis]
MAHNPMLLRTLISFPVTCLTRSTLAGGWWTFGRSREALCVKCLFLVRQSDVKVLYWCLNGLAGSTHQGGRQSHLV